MGEKKFQLTGVIILDANLEVEFFLRANIYRKQVSPGVSTAETAVFLDLLAMEVLPNRQAWWHRKADGPIRQPARLFLAFDQKTR
jgi:hypothetical protein